MHKIFATTLVFFSLVSPAFATSHGISIFGDLKYPPNFTHFEYANPDAPKGGDVKQGLVDTFDSLNAYILKGNPAAGIKLTSESLMTGSDDEPFSRYALIAKAIDVADDRGSVTFTINEKARWHDGTPITVDDVIFSFDTLKAKGHPAYRTYYRDVVKAEQVASDKVRFTFANNKNRELPLIISELPIISKNYYETHDFTKTTLEPPLGNGPYKIEKVEPGKRLILKRVEDYWAKDLPVNKGRYNFDRIIIDYYRDDTVAIEAFKAGEYDIRNENIAKVWAIAYNIPQEKEGLIKKEEIRHEIPTGMQGFAFNLRKPKFSDPRVREAMALAFDFEWENKNFFFNTYTRTNSYFSNSEFASSGLPQGHELELLRQYKGKVPDELFTEEFKVPATDASGYPRENLKKAKKLLEEAGWVIKDRKLVNSQTGEVLQVEFLLHSVSFERLISPFIKNLQKLGIDARIRTVDVAQYQKRLEDFDFDIVTNVFGQSNSPGNEQLDYWHSSKADVRGSKNLMGIKNPVVDELVEKVISSRDKDDLVASVRALDRVLLWNHYLIPNWHLRNFRVIYWDKFSHPEKSPKYDFGFYNWWVDATKETKLKERRD